ncbi:MAG: CheR family methyltransferase [Clostridia bacterium]
MSVQNAEARRDESQAEKKERADKIDYKMVTFSLAGKEYGIDIMNVKEIARAGRFTYVPNSAPFVRGVYNLRGDIISVIDLRTMFHLPAERKQDDALESLLILRVEDHVFGVIVDNIDKVVGVSSSGIQPPHPIFGDINVKYIKGIIENQGKLYIILNVEKLFAPKKAKEEEEAGRLAAVIPVGVKAVSQTPSQEAAYDGGRPQASADVTADFIKETLFSFSTFGVSSVNERWFGDRYAEWKASRKATDIQLKEQSEADQFLEPFYSRSTGALWSEEYMEQIMSALPPLQGKMITAWNPGCSKGYETYSFACAIKRAYPEARLKIWANDSDLLAISMAPNMVFMVDQVPEVYRDYMVKGRNGWTFIQSLRESIFFEFHDVLNSNPVPPVDIILCRDTVSFMSVADQKRLLSEFNEKVKSGGALILGSNEDLPFEGWRRAPGDGTSVYIKGA